MTEHIIKLQTSEGRIFSVELNVAKVSRTLEQIIEDLDLYNSGLHEIITIQLITGEIFEKVLEWMKYECNRNQREANGDGNPDDDPDENFWMVDLEHVNAIAKGADYLNIKGLHARACQVIVNRLRQQLTPSLIHKIFLSIFHEGT